LEKIMQTELDGRCGISRLLRDLRDGVPVHILIAPAALQLLEQLPQILGMFQQLGIRSFHQVLPYADITLWAYSRVLAENPERAFVCSACVGIRCLSQNPCASLMPVYSPLLCAARYLRTYQRMEGSFAFISPCVLKEKEFILENGEELVSYNITIAQLKKFLSMHDDELSRYPSLSAEANSFCPGLTLTVSGTISAALSCLFPEKVFEISQGLSETKKCWTQARSNVVLEAYACRGGCCYGTGTGRKAQKTAPLSKTAIPGAREAVSKLFKSYDQKLKLSDFCFSA
jgi:iron only hydrogenase large subunit-like protein